MDINIIPKFVDNALASPAQAVGSTVTDIWQLAIGSHIALLSDKQKFRQEQNLKEYIDKIEEKTQAIPEENLKDPELHLLGPAIEASRYYIESAELRNMFANLIASSIDSRASEKTHPSFVEIIKQMSPLDARNFQLFKIDYPFPIVEYHITNPEGNYTKLASNIFLGDKVISDYQLMSSSIENISRLGLVTINYTESLKNDDLYKEFENNELFYHFKKQYQQQINDTYEKLEIHRGVTKITQLGNYFSNVCFD